MFGAVRLDAPYAGPGVEGRAPLRLQEAAVTSRVEVLHTAMLDDARREAAHRLLVEAFGDGFSADDWEHTLGGIHALVWENEELIAHGAVVQRRLLHGGRALRCGYVEGVAVRPDRQREGFGTLVMDRLEAVILAEYDLGALSTSDAGIPFYPPRGWASWHGPTEVLTPTGVVRTPEDDGSVLVWGAKVPLDLGGSLCCDWREGDVW